MATCIVIRKNICICIQTRCISAKGRALSVKIFLQVHFIRKTKLRGGAQLFHPQIELYSNSCLACALCLPCYRFTSQKPSSPIIDTFNNQANWLTVTVVMPKISNVVCQVKQFTLSMIHLLVYVLVQCLKYSHKKLFSTLIAKQYWI